MGRQRGETEVGGKEKGRREEEEDGGRWTLRIVQHIQPLSHVSIFYINPSFFPGAVFVPASLMMPQSDHSVHNRTEYVRLPEVSETPTLLPSPAAGQTDVVGIPPLPSSGSGSCFLHSLNPRSFHL